jgi:Phage tail lysozyme
MTRAEWLQLIGPMIGPAITVGAAVAGLALTGVTKRLADWLTAHGEAQASRVVTDANSRLQAAMANAAGQIALQIQAGKIDPTDLSSIRAAAEAAAEAIVRKLPDAVAAVRPVPDAIAQGVAGKITTAMPPAPAAPQTVIQAPAPSLAAVGGFAERAALVVPRLMRDLSLTREQAAGIVGNLGQESGLREINELHPVSGRGGFGWAQWTGPRRIAFEEWCRQRGLLPTDPEANYGFLVEELRTSEAAALTALRACSTVEEAARAFEQHYERAGVVAQDKRLAFAQQALTASS